MKILRNLLLTCFFALPMSVSAASLVNINTANSEQLVDDLVGIGPQKAMAIVRYRQQNGPFGQIEDLAQVSGIGDRTVELNRARITVEAPDGKK